MSKSRKRVKLVKTSPKPKPKPAKPHALAREVLDASVLDRIVTFLDRPASKKKAA